MLKAARHWGRDSSVVNNPLGEPGCTPFYVGFLSALDSVDYDLMLFPICRRDPLWGLRETYMNGMNE